MKYLALLGVAALALACDSPTSPNTKLMLAPRTPSNAVIVNEKFDTFFFAPNLCNGDALILEGTFHEVFAITFDGAGGFHLKDHIDIHAGGTVAATGIDYVMNDVANLEFNGKFGIEQTYTEHYNVIAKGNAPNQVVAIDFHITVTPNGDVTSYHDNFRLMC